MAKGVPLKGTVSFVFPSGLLRLDVQFKKELGLDLLFSRAGFPPRKVPVVTCTACLTVINRVYRLTVNHPLSFVLSNKCVKINASVKFCVYVEIKFVCLTLHLDVFSTSEYNRRSNMSLVVSLFRFSAVTRTSIATEVMEVGVGEGSCGLFIAICIFFSFFALCG